MHKSKLWYLPLLFVSLLFWGACQASLVPQKTIPEKLESPGTKMTPKEKTPTPEKILQFDEKKALLDLVQELKKQLVNKNIKKIIAPKFFEGKKSSDFASRVSDKFYALCVKNDYELVDVEGSVELLNFAQDFEIKQKLPEADALCLGTIYSNRGVYEVNVKILRISDAVILASGEAVIQRASEKVVNNIESLDKELKDANGFVRENAAAQLSRLSLGKAVSMLEKAYLDKDKFIRRGALAGLKNEKKKQVIDMIWEKFERAKTDKSKQRYALLLSDHWNQQIFQHFFSALTGSDARLKKSVTDIFRTLGLVKTAELKDALLRKKVLEDFEGLSAKAATKLAEKIFLEEGKNFFAKAEEKYIKDCSYALVKKSLGLSPLHYAALFNRKEIVEALLKAGVDANIKDKANTTALFLAAHLGNLDSCKLLIAKKADIEAKVEGGTALFIAMQQNDWFDIEKIKVWQKTHRNSGNMPFGRGAFDFENTVIFLIDKGANVYAKDSFGATPLHSAAARSYPEAIKALIKAGAFINAKSKIGKTPLDYFNYYKHYFLVDKKTEKEILKLLKKHGAK